MIACGQLSSGFAGLSAVVAVGKIRLPHYNVSINCVEPRTQINVTMARCAEVVDIENGEFADRLRRLCIRRSGSKQEKSKLEEAIALSDSQQPA